MSILGNRNLKSVPRTPEKSTRRHRNQRGGFLIEAIVACLIAAVVSATLVSSYSRIKRVSTSSNAQLMATMLAQEIVDHLRAQQYGLLATNLGVHQVIVNGTSSSTGDALFPRPIARDPDLTYYQPPANSKLDASDRLNVFHAVNNTIQVTLAQGTASPTSITVAILVRWSDATGTHNYALNTLLAQKGLNG